MAYVEVGTGSQRASAENSSAAPLSCAFPASVLAGSLLVVMGSIYNGADDEGVPEVVDTLGTTYAVYGGNALIQSGNCRRFIAVGLAPSSGANTVTARHPGGGNWAYTHDTSLSIDEFSGASTTALLRTDGGDTYPGTQTTTPSVALTSTAGDLILGVIQCYNPGTQNIQAGSGYTEIGHNDSNNTHGAEFRISTGNDAVTWTISNDHWAASRIALQPQAPAGPSLPVLLASYAQQ